MTNLLSIGQWQGFFKYGAEYGFVVAGQEAEFRLFVETREGTGFSGKIIDWDGFGVDGQVATVKGFVEENDIGFMKQYEQRFIIDEEGNSSVDENWPGHRVFYKGSFNANTNQFEGTWEIFGDIEFFTDAVPEKVAGGTWRLIRDEK